MGLLSKLTLKKKSPDLEAIKMEPILQRIERHMPELKRHVTTNNEFLTMVADKLDEYQRRVGIAENKRKRDE